MEDATQENGRELGAAARITMTNQLVLTKIAAHLPGNFLATLRKTCTLWNRAFVPQFREKHLPVILENTERSEHKPFHRKYVDFEGFLKVMGASTNLPVSRYQLGAKFGCYGMSATQVTEWRRGFDQFASQFSNTITSFALNWERRVLSVPELRILIFDQMPQLQHLLLRPEDSPEEEEGVEMEPRLTKSLTNMKSLHVNEDWHELGQPLLNLVTDIVQSAMPLENLYLNKEEGHQDDQCAMPMVAILSGLSKSRQQTKLKSLSLCHLGFHHLQELVVLALPPTGLRLRVLHATMEFEGEEGDLRLPEVSNLLHSFLGTQSQSLRKLSLNCRRRYAGVHHPDTPFRIPHLGILHTLDLERTGEYLGLRFDGGNMQDVLPCLKRLIYYRDDSEHSSGQSFEEDVSQMSHNGVEDLEVMGLRALEFVKLPATFPSVTHLDTDSRFQDAVPSIQAILPQWPLLKTLGPDAKELGLVCPQLV